MKYLFVQLFPALNQSRPAARIGAADFDAFEVGSGAPPEDDNAELADAESEVAPISS